MKRTDEYTLAITAFAFVGIIWGSNFIFMKLSSNYITPLQIVFVRVLFGFIPILGFAIYKKALSRHHLKYAMHFFSMGMLATVIYYFGFAKGTSLLNSGIAGAISGAIPLFSLGAAMIFLREEKITCWKIVGAVIGFLGVLGIARPFDSDGSSNSMLGITYMVIGSLSVGLSFIYAKRFISPLKLSPLTLTTYQLGSGLIVLFLITDFSGINKITENSTALLSMILGLGLAGTGVAYLCYYFIIDKLGALAASSVTYIPPVVALIIATTIAGEEIELQDFIFTGLILCAVSIVTWSNKKTIPTKN